MDNKLEFFLVSLPGLEDLLVNEIQEWFPHLTCVSEYGGVSVTAELGEGLGMNQALKVPTRILLRVAKFRARDFPKLYHKACEIDWASWLDLSCTMEVFAATHRSRLKIKSRVEETCLDGWIVAQKKAGIKPSAKKSAKLYVRIVDDEVTLSLDTSGDRLHKRGNRKHIGEAPLRETIAAALIQMVGKSAIDDKRPVELIDPMMGSGTFLLEAALRDRLVEARDFAFDCFAAQPEKMPVLQATRPLITKGIGYEMDKQTLKAASTNLKTLLTTMQIEIKPGDFFTALPLEKSESHARWVLINPPYGERLEVKEPLMGYYEKLFMATERIAHPDRACFLLPAKGVKGKLTLPPQWKVIEKRRFLNGGIPVVAFLFGRQA